MELSEKDLAQRKQSAIEVLREPVFQAARKVSKDLGMPAYVVGGYVRDWLLGLPSKDIDIVAIGDGVAFAKAFAAAVNAPPPVTYGKFGTAMVTTPEGDIEFATARKESYDRQSRKPDVTPGTLRDDQLRRDFTINALSFSLNEADFGEILDPFGGVEDLKNGIIRTPTNPDITFSDDPLRMLRAVRFAGRLGFEIERDTFQAIIRNAGRLEIISVERILGEFNKVLLQRKPSVGLNLLFESKLLHQFFPELVAMHGVSFVKTQGHKDNFYHTLQVVDNAAEKSDNLWFRWVAVLHDIAKPLTKRYEPGIGWTFHGHEDKGARMVKGIFKRMKLPMDEQMRYVEKLVRLHQRPIALVNEEVSDSAIRRLSFDAGEDLEDLLDFCRADITSKNENKVTRFLSRYDALALRIREVVERDNLRNWQPPVNGELIMATFNIPPGPIVGAIKNQVREAILDGIISNDPATAIAYMHEIAPQHLGNLPPDA